MSGSMSISGLSSGLDIDSILSKMEEIERTPITRAQTQRSTLNAQYEAWKTANTRLLAVKEKAQALSRLEYTVSKSVSSSDASVAVTATSSAAAGITSFHVEAIAAYHQQTSQAYTDQDITALGTGTMNITVNGTTTEIAINNLTLSGLRDTINNSTSGVKASIVSTGGATPAYRLVLTSQTLGSAGAMTVTSTLAGATAPVLTELQAATDTTLTFGSGANAFTVQRSSNTITDVIPGVTINLSSSALDKTVAINVSENHDALKTAVQNFVDQFNAYLSFVSEQNKYDSKTEATGVLFGAYQLIQVKNDLSSKLTTPIPGLPAALNTINSLGVKFDGTGNLVFDTSTFEDALKSNMTGVYKMFGVYGTATNPAVSYLSSLDETVAGATGYTVEVTQVATQAKLFIGSGGSGLPDTLAQNETLTLNGISIELTQGMTRIEAVSAINAQAAKTGVKASLTDNIGTGAGNYLTLVRSAYGANLPIEVSSNVAAGTAGSTGIGDVQISAVEPGVGNSAQIGQDIAGTINGIEATGSGQTLTATGGDANGLKIAVNATTTGDYGTVTFTRGVGFGLDKMLKFVTDSIDGSIPQTQTSLQKSMDRIDEDIERLEANVTRTIDRMRTRFNAMEVAMGKLQNQSSSVLSLISSMSSSSSSSSSS